MSSVLIKGEGIAGSCCARLLRDAGATVSIEKSGRPKLPAIMLGDVTQKLLADVFRRPDLFAGLPRIKRRVVAWGQSAEYSTVPHSAVVVSEEELWRRIRQGFVQSTNEEADWTIFASFSMPSSSIEHHFGSRMAQTTQVKLREHHDAEAC